MFRPSDLLQTHVMGMRPIGLVAIDTETSGLYADDGARVSVVSLAWEIAANDVGAWRETGLNVEQETIGDWQHWIASVAWPFDQGVAGKPEDNGQESLFGEVNNLGPSDWDDLFIWLLTHNHVYHNAKFDLEKLRVGTRLWRGRDLSDHCGWDTQNVNHLLWPLYKTSLKPTSQRLFGAEVADEAALVHAYLKKAKLPAGRWDLIPWDIIGPYADQDARLTKKLELYQRWVIEVGQAGVWLGSPDEVLAVAERRLETMLLLYRMEWRGVPYDEAGSNEAAYECRKRGQIVSAKLPFSPPTRVQAVRYFFTDAGLNMVPYATSEKTGEPSLTAEIVQRMVEDQVPDATLWADLQKVNTAASMWYEAYARAVGPDGRLRTCFRQNGTRSSRFSVERVNLQAIPHDYRLSEFEILEGIPTPRQLVASAVEAMPGWSLWELDLAQAELRVASLFAECEPMLRMIRNEEDLHTFTTKALFPDVDPADPLFKNKWRQVGKRGNFSLCFGAEWLTFQRMVSKETGIRLADSESQRIVREWNALYPEFRPTIEAHSRKVQRRQDRQGRGWVGLRNRERRWFEPYEETHKAFNQRVQGNLAQFGIDWMLETDKIVRDYLGAERAPDGGQGGLLLTIHDSQVLLLPDDMSQEIVDECAQVGRDMWTTWFPGVPGDVDSKEW